MDDWKCCYFTTNAMGEVVAEEYLNRRIQRRCWATWMAIWRPGPARGRWQEQRRPCDGEYRQRSTPALDGARRPPLATWASSLRRRWPIWTAIKIWTSSSARPRTMPWTSGTERSKFFRNTGTTAVHLRLAVDRASATPSGMVRIPISPCLADLGPPRRRRPAGRPGKPWDFDYRQNTGGVSASCGRPANPDQSITLVSSPFLADTDDDGVDSIIMAAEDLQFRENVGTPRGTFLPVVLADRHSCNRRRRGQLLGARASGSGR